MSGFINHIFLNFKETAGSSIAHAVQERRTEYRKILSKLKEGRPEETITLLVEDYERQLVEEMHRKMNRLAEENRHRKKPSEEEAGARRKNQKEQLTLYCLHQQRKQG